MNIREKYTTEAIKAEILADKNKTPKEKEAENNKIVISDEAMLNSEMLNSISKKLVQLRLKW